MTELGIVEIFSKVLKNLMQERGVSAAVVSKACGIPKSSLSEWLAGRQPKLDASIVKLAKFFNVSVEFLVTGETPEEAIVKDLVNDLENNFVSIHRGIYRINIEKYSATRKTKKGDSK